MCVGRGVALSCLSSNTSGGEGIWAKTTETSFVGFDHSFVYPPLGAKHHGHTVSLLLLTNIEPVSFMISVRLCHEKGVNVTNWCHEGALVHFYRGPSISTSHFWPMRKPSWIWLRLSYRRK